MENDQLILGYLLVFLVGMVIGSLVGTGGVFLLSTAGVGCYYRANIRVLAEDIFQPPLAL